MKAAVFGVVLLLVSYPDPRLLARHVARVRNMNALVEPDAPEMAGFEQDFRAYWRRQAPRGSSAASRPQDEAGASASQPVGTWAAAEGAAVRRAVERFVYSQVRYEWDWNVWGAADYVPTVSEMFARGRASPDGRLREDCDGRAVLAASLLRRLGYEAELVTDLRHVWVRAPRRGADESGRAVELMGPGRAKSVVFTERGARFDPTTITNLPVAISFGVAVFPWQRELVVFVTLALLVSHRRMSPRAAAAGLLLALAGWMLMRAGISQVGQAGEAAYRWEERPLNSAMGLGYVVAGFWVMAAAGRSARAAAPGTGGSR